jgi:hypothetical protein
MLSAIFGLGAVVLGLWGMYTWGLDLIHFLKGMIPISMFFAGIIAIIAGFSSLSSKRPPSGSKKGS